MRCPRIHQIPNPPNSIQTQIATRTGKKTYPLLQDYQRLEVWIRCSLNIVGVQCMLDIMQTILVAVRVHQLLVSRQAFLFLQQRAFSPRLGLNVVIVCTETCTCASQYDPYNIRRTRRLTIPRPTVAIRGISLKWDMSANHGTY